ncbi:MAG: hypothetical protein GC157_03350 [Frankiales bacterium]|nr:hypothetical protein [Frankiales bacterium]
MSHVMQQPTAVASHSHVQRPVSPEPRGHPRRAVAALSVRQVRRSTLVIAAMVVVWVVVEVASFRTAYPDGVSPTQFAMFADNPAVRMMQGIPYDIGTAAGFTVWDAGWLLTLLMAIWGSLTSTRLLRGEEESGRADLLLAGPLRPASAMLVVLGITSAAALVLGSAVGVTLGAASSEWSGALLFGLVIAGTGVTFTAVGALASQVFDVRRRAAGLALGLVGLAWVVRMVVGTDDGRLWLRWLTPFGWLDELHAFGSPAPAAILAYAVAWASLAALAVVLRGRRDAGSALLVDRAAPRPRLRGLSGPTAFAWRTTRGTLLAWALLLAAYSAVFGGLTVTMVDWLEGDEQYRNLLEQFGFGDMLSVRGFMAVMTSFSLLAIVLQVAWRVGAARVEEEAGRLDAVLARPVSRLRWLAGHAVLALVGGIALLVVAGAATWLGAVLAGSEEVTWTDALAAALNGAPVVLLAAGLGVAAFGLVPRATVAVPATVLPVAYLLTLLGPALSWPSWLLDLSPFTHLALVPVQPWGAAAGLVMCALGVALLVLGAVAFHRRDLQTA